MEFVRITHEPCCIYRCCGEEFEVDPATEENLRYIDNRLLPQCPKCGDVDLSSLEPSFLMEDDKLRRSKITRNAIIVFLCLAGVFLWDFEVHLTTQHGGGMTSTTAGLSFVQMILAMFLYLIFRLEFKETGRKLAKIISILFLSITFLNAAQLVLFFI